MNWITVAWPAIGGACLALAGMHVVVWLKDRRAGASLAFAGLAVSVACIAAFELALTRAETPAQFGALRSGMQVPVFTGFVCILLFVHLHLRAGRPALAHATWIVRLIGLLFNSLSPPHLFYRDLTGLRHIEFLGAVVTVGDGVPSQWLWLNQLSVLLLVVFVADATIAIWRRGGAAERRRAAVIGGSLLAFLLCAGILMALVSWQVVVAPFLVSPIFLILVCAMGYELSREVLRAAQLARDLTESERRVELAVDAARLGLWTWDLARDEIWATAQARALYGLTSAERLSLGLVLDAIHPEDREAVRAELMRATRQGGSFEHEYRVAFAGGGERWLAAMGRVEAGEQGEPVRVRGIAMDVSERRRAEQEIAQHRAVLAHLTRAHTMGELSGALAHELNQPLGIILSNAQAARQLLAREPPDVAETREILADIVAADRRASEVIQRLRALLERGEVVLRPVAVNDLVDDVLHLVTSELRGRGVVVARELGAELPLVSGDRVQLQQLLLNLVMNGADAMAQNPPGSRRLLVTTEWQAGAVRIEVRDHGVGLPPDPERLFEAFFTTKPNGLGMGLAICRSIARAHGGRLWAASHPDGGAVFSFDLPAVEAGVLS